MSEAPLLITRAEAAALLGVSVKSFDQHVRPQLATVQVGRLPRFRRAEVEAWIVESGSAEPRSMPRASAASDRVGNGRVRPFD